MVITGGSTQLPGMAELGEDILGIPVRAGIPKGVGGLADLVKSPGLATAVGLVEYAANQQAGNVRNMGPPSRGGMFGRLRRVISTAF